MESCGGLAQETHSFPSKVPVIPQQALPNNLVPVFPSEQSGACISTTSTSEQSGTCMLSENTSRSICQDGLKLATGSNNGLQRNDGLSAQAHVTCCVGAIMDFNVMMDSVRRPTCVSWTG
jgi:hypothetical protein